MPVKHVGVDGCNAGWFTVVFSGADWTIQLLPSAFSVWYTYRDASRILINIPIGLTDSHKPRVCDQEARKRLSPHRHNSVFAVPCRSAVYEDTYRAAHRVNKRIQGKGLNSYSWGIASRIRELDELLEFNPAAQHRIRETHPEICYWALNGFEAMEHGKQTDDGYEERYELLTRIDHRAEAIIDTALSKYRDEGVARDDILDAIAITIIAAGREDALKTLPAEPETDAKGLPMEIVYSEAPEVTQRTMADFA